MKITIILFALQLFVQATFAANESEVLKTFKTYDGLTFRGKMSYPQDLNTKKTGVLLIHGSGPMDMNLWLPGFISADGKPHKAFEAIARDLQANNIISFRYNKRGVEDDDSGSPNIDYSVYEAITWSQLVNDAYSALEVLKNDPHVDSNKILILGISQGTLIAPAVAAKAGYVDGLVLMASIGKSNDNYKDIAKLNIPVLLQHGDVDTVTPLDEATTIEKELKQNQVPYDLIVYPKLGHGFSKMDGGSHILGPIEPQVITDIHVWINKLF